MDRKKVLSNTIGKIVVLLTLGISSSLIFSALFGGIIIDRTSDKVPISNNASNLALKIIIGFILVGILLLLINQIVKLVKVTILKEEVTINKNANLIELVLLLVILVVNVITLKLFPVDYDKYNLYSYALSIANIVISATGILYIMLSYINLSDKPKITVEVLSEGAVLAALAIVLSLVSKMIPGLELPNGGSFSLSVLPLFIFGFRRGSYAGLLIGAVYGVINFLTDGAVAIHLAVPFVDYLLPFAFLTAIAGLFSKKAQEGHVSAIILGVLIGGFVRYVFHGFSGVIFFSEYAGDNNVWFYSFILYNLPYMLGSTVLCLIFALLLKDKFIYSSTRLK